MGDLNEDLLNYEADLLEDDILDDNEDELLLSDDDNADAEALLSDSEDWIDDELRSKPKTESGDSSSNAVSGSNDIAEARQDSPEESTIATVAPSESTPEKPTGSNEKTTEHVSSTPDKSLELGDPDQSQESGVSNAVDSTWVNTPDACVSNNLEEVDGSFVRNNNEVSSTNAEEERAAQQLEGSKCVSSSSIDSTPTIEQNNDVDTPATSACSEIVSSFNDTPLTTSNETVEREAETTETEEDEREERINPKLSVEKPEENLNNKGVRVPSGHKNHKQSSNSFEGITPLYPPRHDFPYGPNRIPFPPHRPGFGSMRAPYFMPRPTFNSLPPGMRSGMMRPDMRIPFDPTRPRQQIPMYPRGPLGSFPPNVMPPNQMPYSSGGLNVQSSIPIIPKKVLINPNFKGGGLEAATSQLLKDTQQFGSRSLTDEELLRQQEEFITKNLMHVEKRRHESPPSRLRSRSRSPRSRSRSYSPQRSHRRSREKDWRPYNNKRNWRRNNDDWNKRRRIEDKEKDENPDDDEETREYRRKVAEQKALREKMLRDKERRRRELAEENKRQLQEEEEKRKKEEPVLKCKPVVVTKKIISLKAIKSSGSDNEDRKLSQDSGLSSSGNGKNMSFNKMFSEDDDVKTMAVVKPIQSLQTTKKPVIDGIDEKLEAELLEESRTPSPPPPALLNSNRRVIIKSKPKVEETVTEDATSKKRIFDRLDRKSSAIGIDSLAKRKIQRLVSDKSK
ncbi:RNA-binding protein 33 [Culicoides brevitarsis]|uniref:RNA-binding protein 33 n=1 Tax=Culicoides brevitarsis TaxID=469753 RepID=UPI00307B1835